MSALFAASFSRGFLAVGLLAGLAFSVFAQVPLRGWNGKPLCRRHSINATVLRKTNRFWLAVGLMESIPHSSDGALLGRAIPL